jgi:hypothetical protein
MKRALLGLLIGCLTMGLASIAMAGENAIAGISLHVTDVVFKNPCLNAPVLDGPDDIDTEGWPCPQSAKNLASFSVWLLVCNGSDSLGVAGLECGIEYNGLLGQGIDIDSWTPCGDLEFTSGGWPAPGSGNIVTWDPVDNCQIESSVPDTVLNHMVIAVAGVFNVTLYGKDEFQITPRPVSGRAKIADCAAVEDDITDAVPSQLGMASFCRGNTGGGGGYNFCERLDYGAMAAAPLWRGLPVETTTWGRIKGKY